MKLISLLTLENGYQVYTIINSKNAEEAKKWAINNSIRLIKSNELQITNKASIQKCEEWKNERLSAYQDGNKTYTAAFFLDNITQILYVNAPGIKSAYNNIRLKYGIKENINMILIDNNQMFSKKSALIISKDIIKDRCKLNKLISKASDKIRETKILNAYTANFYILFNMLWDYCNGNYREVNINSVIGIVSCVLYFTNCDTVTLDISEDYKCLDKNSALIIGMKRINNDLLNFTKWVENKDKLCKVLEG